MYKLVLLFVLPVITRAESDFLDAAAALFDLVDNNGDGNVLRNESVSSFHFLDYNRDSIVDYEEYLVAVEVEPVFDGYEAQVYSLIDFSKDGLLTLDDFENDFVYFDTNKDDVVSKEEFLAHMQQA